MGMSVLSRRGYSLIIRVASRPSMTSILMSMRMRSCRTLLSADHVHGNLSVVRDYTSVPNLLQKSLAYFQRDGVVFDEEDVLRHRVIKIQSIRDNDDFTPARLPVLQDK